MTVSNPPMNPISFRIKSFVLFFFLPVSAIIRKKERKDFYVYILQYRKRWNSRNPHLWGWYRACHSWYFTGDKGTYARNPQAAYREFHELWAGPYCPIYGCGALAVLHILDPFGYSIPLMFGMGIVVTSALEYVTSWGMEVLFHTKWWDYSSYPFNIHGRVCLKNSLLFGCMVLVVYYLIHPRDRYLRKNAERSKKKLCTSCNYIYANGYGGAWHLKQ